MKAIVSMRAGMAMFVSAGWFAGVLLFATAARAQRSAPSTAAAQAKAVAEGRNHALYDASKEVSLQGTVASFTENSKQFPAGAHVVVQSSAGPVDVHLGDARLLKLNNMTISQGASVRIIGEPVTTPQGTFFLARLIQQGSQVVAVRGMTGMPLSPAGSRTTTSQHSSSDACHRGIRRRLQRWRRRYLASASSGRLFQFQLEGPVCVHHDRPSS
jgi:hypothetical protein